MAITTNNEKLAVIEWDQSYEPGLPISPGALGQDDQQQLLWGFPGVLWQPVALTPLSTAQDYARLAHMEWCQVWEPSIGSGVTTQGEKQQLIWGYPAVLWGESEAAGGHDASLVLKGRRRYWRNRVYHDRHSNRRGRHR